MTRDEFCLTLQHIRADSSGITAKAAAISEYDRLTAELAQARKERDEARFTASITEQEEELP